MGVIIQLVFNLVLTGAGDLISANSLTAVSDSDAVSDSQSTFVSLNSSQGDDDLRSSAKDYASCRLSDEYPTPLHIYCGTLDILSDFLSRYIGNLRKRKRDRDRQRIEL